MRLSYIVLAHHLPDQVIRLARRLNTPDSVFYIHWDRRSADADLDRIRGALESECRVEPLPRHACHWGTFSIVSATLEGIKAACASGPFERLILLSGQDYPIKPVRAIHEFFEDRPTQSFVHRVALPKPDWPDGGWDRVRRRWEHPQNAPEGTLNALDGPPRVFPETLRPHGGAQFWVMTSELAHFVNDFSDNHPDTLAFFEDVFAPDEIYVQTVAAVHRQQDNIANDTLHFLEWHRSGNVLRTSDIQRLAGTYHLFARKFDSRIDDAVFDVIDERLLG